MIQYRPYAILSAPTPIQQFKNNKTILKSQDNIVASCLRLDFRNFTCLYTYQNWICVPVRYRELNMCAVLGWVGTKSHGNSTFSTGFGWVGTTGYDVCGYDLDENGKRSFAWVRFGWVRELRFVTGPVPFPIPVEIPREKYPGNIPERSLGNVWLNFLLFVRRCCLTFTLVKNLEYVVTQGCWSPRKTRKTK